MLVHAEDLDIDIWQGLVGIRFIINELLLCPWILLLTDYFLFTSFSGQLLIKDGVSTEIPGSFELRWCCYTVILFEWCRNFPKFTL